MRVAKVLCFDKSLPRVTLRQHPIELSAFVGPPGLGLQPCLQEQDAAHEPHSEVGDLVHETGGSAIGDASADDSHCIGLPVRSSLRKAGQQLRRALGLPMEGRPLRDEKRARWKAAVARSLKWRPQKSGVMLIEIFVGKGELAQAFLDSGISALTRVAIEGVGALHLDLLKKKVRPDAASQD